MGSRPGPSGQGAHPRGWPPSSQCSSPSCLTSADGAGSSHSFSPTALCILKTIYAHRHSFSAGVCQALFLFCPSGLCQQLDVSLSLPILQRRRLRLRGAGRLALLLAKAPHPHHRQHAPCPRQVVLVPVRPSRGRSGWGGGPPEQATTAWGAGRGADPPSPPLGFYRGAEMPGMPHGSRLPDSCLSA